MIDLTTALFRPFPSLFYLSPYTMAKKGAQHVLEENKKRIRLLTSLVAVSIVRACFGTSVVVKSLSPPTSSPLHHQHQTQAAFLYARFLRPSAPKALGRHLLGFSTAGAVSSLSLLALRRHAEPVFDPSSGALLDGGGDLRETGGMTSTMHDAIYVSALALLLGSRYDAALLLLFLPVLYALFKFWSSVLAPGVFTPTAREAREEAGGGSSSSGKRGRGVMPRSGGGGGGGGARRGEGRRA